MSAMHWEGRRKQLVLDAKSEAQTKVEDAYRSQRTGSCNKSDIEIVAEELSKDAGSPLSSMMRKTRVRLNSRSKTYYCPQTNKAEKRYVHKVAEENTYSAKLPNRYNSVHYVQQH